MSSYKNNYLILSYLGSTNENCFELDTWYNEGLTLLRTLTPKEGHLDCQKECQYYKDCRYFLSNAESRECYLMTAEKGNYTTGMGNVFGPDFCP